MTKESEPRSKLGDGRSSSPQTSIQTSIREKQQPVQAERAKEAAETTMIAPKKEGLDAEKAVHTRDNVQEGTPETIALSTAQDSAANATSPDNFGREDDKYISGVKLYGALFGIVSVFFLVLLDFSILSTVSTDNPQDHCVDRVFTSMIEPYWLDG
jgi:hypothetical protein